MKWLDLIFGGDWGFFWERNDMTQAKHNGDLITVWGLPRAQLLLIEMITEMCFVDLFAELQKVGWSASRQEVMSTAVAGRRQSESDELDIRNTAEEAQKRLDDN